MPTSKKAVKPTKPTAAEIEETTEKFRQGERFNTRKKIIDHYRSEVNKGRELANGAKKEEEEKKDEENYKKFQEARQRVINGSGGSQEIRNQHFIEFLLALSALSGNRLFGPVTCALFRGVRDVGDGILTRMETNPGEGWYSKIKAKLKAMYGDRMDILQDLSHLRMPKGNPITGRNYDKECFPLQYDLDITPDLNNPQNPPEFALEFKDKNGDELDLSSQKGLQAIFRLWAAERGYKFAYDPATEKTTIQHDPTPGTPQKTAEEIKNDIMDNLHGVNVHNGLKAFGPYLKDELKVEAHYTPGLGRR